MYLLDNLHDHVENAPTMEFGGPPTTTFLLAMAMPLIIIPMERLADKRRRSSIRDRGQDRALDDRIGIMLAEAFGETELRGDGVWYHKVVQLGMEPPRWAGRDAIETDGNQQSAESLSTREILEGLRHGLAHGNVVYLSEDYSCIGRQQVRRLAFTWHEIARNPRDPRGQCIPVAQNVLVTDQEAFRHFLRAWAIEVANSPRLRRLLQAS